MLISLRKKNEVYRVGERRIIHALHNRLSKHLSTYNNKVLLNLLVSSFLSNINKNPSNIDNIFTYQFLLRYNSPTVFYYIHNNYRYRLIHDNNILHKFNIFKEILSNHTLLEQWDNDMLKNKKHKRDYLYWK